MRVLNYLRSGVWEEELRALDPYRRAVAQAVRTVWAIGDDFAHGELNLRAMGLVYNTLLALVPLLAVSFSVLKAFGVHNQLEPLLLNFLEPLGPKGAEIGERVVGFVENIQVGVLGSVGLALLIYTVISLIQKIEHALNVTWHVKRLRGFSQRFSGYMSVLLLGPVLMFSAVGLMASIRDIGMVEQLISLEPVAVVVYWTGQIVPYLLIIGAFALVYVLIPNTRVQIRPALLGGVVAGLLWKSLAWAFATFVASSTKYTAIYSGFAILLLFMIWLYLNWLTLLIGAEVAYYVQHPEMLVGRRGRTELSNRLKEKLALSVMVLIGCRYYAHESPWTQDGLVRRIGVAAELVESVLGVLVGQGLLVETSADPPAFLPARDLGGLRVDEFLGMVRRAGEGGGAAGERAGSVPAVDQRMREIERTLDQALGNLSIEDLIVEELGAGVGSRSNDGHGPPGDQLE